MESSNKHNKTQKPNSNIIKGKLTGNKKCKMIAKNMNPNLKNISIKPHVRKNKL